MAGYTTRLLVFDDVEKVAKKLEENGIDFAFDDGEHIRLRPEDEKDAEDLLAYNGMLTKKE